MGAGRERKNQTERQKIADFIDLHNDGRLLSNVIDKLSFYKLSLINYRFNQLILKSCATLNNQIIRRHNYTLQVQLLFL
jgi:hypothetical protein